MIHDPWFWGCIGSYLFGGLSVLLWLSDGTVRFGDIPKWLVCVTVALWPVPILGGMAERFTDYLMSAKKS